MFALLAWLSISFNMLLIGAAWTRVRALAMAQPAPPADPTSPDAAAARDEAAEADAAEPVRPGACRSGGRSARSPRATGRS